MTSADQDLFARVASHPFLHGMNERQLRILSDCAQLLQLVPNEMLFRAGEPARGFFLLEGGSISVEGRSEDDERPVTIDIVTAGGPLGWSWMFEPYVCEYSARATEPARVIFFDAMRLADHPAGDLTLGHELFKRMSQVMVRRLNAARAKLLETARAASS